MKAIMINLTPKECANLFNGNLSILVRKKFPKGFIGWCYVHCARRERLYKQFSSVVNGELTNVYWHTNKDGGGFYGYNNKVLARFWCDKVEKIKWHKDTAIDLDYYKVVNVIENKEILKASCLQLKELEDYLQIKNAKNIPTTWGITFNLGKAINITNLEIFEKPKEISEFYSAFTKKRYERIFGNNTVELDEKYGGLRQPIKSGYEYTYPLTRAPQSWCYIEI